MNEPMPMPMTDMGADAPMDDASIGPDWLSVARSAYSQSTDWMDVNLRRQWERNIAAFQSRHATGSKYSTDAYRGRSRLFMPKTRAAMRSNEAAVAASYFSTGDVVNIAAVNQSDGAQVVASRVMDELMNHRLTKTIPWFLLVVGAYQDTEVHGVCASKQVWQFEETESVVAGIDPMTGQEVERITAEVTKDRPWIELIPPENLRIDAAADWLDPIGTSPYVIHLIPMRVMDVEARMESVDRKTGRPQWHRLSRSEMQAAIKQNDDTTSREREQNRTTPDDSNEITDFTLVWVHENHVRMGGRDWVYWTLGTEHLLTDPVPLREVYLTGKRPFVLGMSNIEAHRTYPAAHIEMGQDVQAALNDTVNQRRDNVELVLNRRYKVQRGKNVDVRGLTRSVPGGVYLVDDMNAVAPDVTQDVTGSAYVEQDRLQMAFDEVAGAFSTSTVQANRKLNETATGMSLMSDGANAIRELSIRTFNETWVEPVLRQLMALEQAYETDAVVLGIAADRAELYEEWRTAQGFDLLLSQDVNLTVNVGMGATNPIQRVEKFLFGLNAVAPFMGNGVKPEEVIAEVFGALGYKDGKRFYVPPDPDAPPPDPAAEAKMAELQIKQAELELERERFEFDKLARAEELRMKREIELAKAAAQQQYTAEQIAAALGVRHG